MLKFLTLVALVVSAVPSFAADTGAMIDEMMRKNAGEAKVDTAKTAESALPSKREEKKEAAVKNIEATQPVFSNPVVAATATKETGKSLWGKMALSLIFALSIFGGVVFAYRKWPGSKKIIQRAKMIEVLNQQHLGPRKSLAVVRVAGEAVLIGITDTNITLLKSLSLLDDDLPVETKEAKYSLKNSENYKFESALGAKSQEPKSREDEFSMQGLKDFIGDRLKNMKEIR